jgi:hypothetical protein
MRLIWVWLQVLLWSLASAANESKAKQTLLTPPGAKLVCSNGLPGIEADGVCCLSSCGHCGGAADATRDVLPCAKRTGGNVRRAL